MIIVEYDDFTTARRIYKILSSNLTWKTTCPNDGGHLKPMEILVLGGEEVLTRH
jgi:hypothetical protein